MKKMQVNQSSFGNFQTNQTKSRKNYGNLIPLRLDPVTEQPTYFLGPHFYVFIPTWLVSIGLILYILYSLMHLANEILLIMSAISSLVFLYCYLKMGFSSPGVASSAEQIDSLEKYDERYCIPCKIIRSKDTRHCYYCDVCIYAMDHHCPWIGKCVGRDNICLFYKFLLSVGIMMAFLLLSALTSNSSPQQSQNSPPKL